MKRFLSLLLSFLLIFSTLTAFVSCNNDDNDDDDSDGYTLPDFDKLDAENETLQDVLDSLSSQGYGTYSYFLGFAAMQSGEYDIYISVLPFGFSSDDSDSADSSTDTETDTDADTETDTATDFSSDSSLYASRNASADTAINASFDNATDTVTDTSADSTDTDEIKAALEKAINEKYPVNEYEIFEDGSVTKTKFTFIYTVRKRYPTKTTSNLNADKLCSEHSSISELTAHLSSLSFDITKSYNKSELESLFLGYENDLLILDNYTGASLYIKQESEYTFSVVEIYKFESQQYAKDAFSNNSTLFATTDYTLNNAKHIKAGISEHVFSTEAHIFKDGSSCLMDHYTLGKCVCGFIEPDIEENRTYVSAQSEHLDPEFVKVSTAATCVGEGKDLYHCKACDQDFNKTTSPADPNAHKLGSVISAEVKPTCESDGYGTFYCSLCETIIEGTIPGGHIYSYVYPPSDDGFHYVGGSITAPSFTKTCLRCGYVNFPSFITVVPEYDISHTINLTPLSDSVSYNTTEEDGQTTVNIEDSLYNASSYLLDNYLVVCYDVVLEHTEHFDGTSLS